MTATDETTGTRQGSSLAPVASGILARVQGSEPWTVADLADALAGSAPKLPAAEPFPDLAPVVQFTPVLRRALKALSAVVGRVNPTTRRMLEPSELALITEERAAINAVVKPLEARSKAISTMVRHHQDLQAEKGKQAGKDTPRVADGVAKGHYLLAEPGSPFVTGVEGYTDGWRQVYVSGKPYQSLSALENLLADGTITRQEYLAMTRETRSLAQDKITTFIARNPDRGLKILAAITRREAPGASLYAPKNKTEG